MQFPIARGGDMGHGSDAFGAAEGEAIGMHSLQLNMPVSSQISLLVSTILIYQRFATRALLEFDKIAAHGGL
jgi:hypothetical protein